MEGKDNLTSEKFKLLWKEELLPDIRREFKVEIDSINVTLKEITERCTNIEQSQTFLSAKYDKLIEVQQASNKEITSLRRKINEQDGLLKKQEDESKQLRDIAYQQDCAMDELQQYIRRDCLEIQGIPYTKTENIKELVKDICTLVDANISEEHISTAHRLPDTQKIKNRLIVKFTHRDKRDELYKKRKNLKGKNTGHLTSYADKASNATSYNKIHINESLTAYRKQLFNRIYSFKKQHSYKFIWTVNGKILIRKNEEQTSKSFGFATHEEFDDFISKLGLE